MKQKTSSILSDESIKICPGPSASQSLPGPSASQSHPGPSASQSLPGPSTSPQILPGSSPSSQSLPGPSTSSQSLPGPSTSPQSLPGPSTSQSLPGPQPPCAPPLRRSARLNKTRVLESVDSDESVILPIKRKKTHTKQLQDQPKISKKVATERKKEKKCTVEDQNQFMKALTLLRVKEVKMLLKRGVDPNFQDGIKPLHMIVNMYTEQGAGLFGTDTKVQDILGLLLQFGAKVETRIFGRTALHRAATRSPETLNMLLQAGASVNAEDELGFTPLMEACKLYMHETPSHKPDALKIVNSLLDYQANVLVKDIDGCTALHWVCMNNNDPYLLKANIAEMLIHHGAPTNVEDCFGKTPIFYEIENILFHSHNGLHKKEGFFKLLETLLKAGPCFDCNNKHQQVCVQRLCYTLVNDRPIFAILAKKFTDILSLRQVKFVKQCLSNYATDQNRELNKIVDDMTKEVHSLKSLSRLVIRHELGGNMLLKLDQLFIPSTLKNYLKFSSS